ncbi:MAG: cation:proton antiporter [Planctomycetia bacterium]|nr:cation:proton antiporter [Planctomycetia bacterium]
MHVDPLLMTLAAGFTLAVVLGMVAHRLRLSPILGYLLAGVVVGPHTPGFVADARLAAQLAEIGVVLLMFGVGLHFHLKDLLAVRGVAVPGALIQSAAATGLGIALGLALGWRFGDGLVLGLSVSVASTVVLIRVLTAAGTLETPAGHVAVGWLVVEDLLTVVALVLLPAVAPALRGEGGDVGKIAWALGGALVKLTLLVAVVAFAGARLIPPLLARVARTRSRELFTLSVLAVALAVAALAAVVFDASPALGAFLAGMVVAGSAVRHQAAADALPLRDAFAVLFFVSAGMQFDPGLLVSQPLLVGAVLAIVLVGKPIAALLVVLGLGWSVRTALTVAFALAQVGEFSFILATLGLGLGVLPAPAAGAIVTAALLSIAVNPWMMGRVEPVERWLRARPRLWRALSRRNAEVADALAPAHAAPVEGEQRALVVGFGPAGRAAADALSLRGLTPVIVEANVDTVRQLTLEGRRAVFGDATRATVLEDAGLVGAKVFVVSVAAPDLAAQAVVAARGLDARIPIIVRARYLAEREALLGLGATAVTVDEEAVAGGLSSYLLRLEWDPAASRDAAPDA